MYHYITYKQKSSIFLFLFNFFSKENQLRKISFSKILKTKILYISIKITILYIYLRLNIYYKYIL